MIKQQLVQDQISALKAGAQEKLTTLRYILAQIKNKEIDKRSELTEEETVIVLKKFVKELHESIEAFNKGNRPDLVAQSQAQLDLVSAYLPPEMTNDDLKKEIEKIISQNQAIYDKNAKAVIGICIKELKGKADSARIIKILQTR